MWVTSADLCPDLFLQALNSAGVIRPILLHVVIPRLASHHCGAAAGRSRNADGGDPTADWAPMKKRR